MITSASSRLVTSYPYEYVHTYDLFRQLTSQICTGDTGHAEAVQLQYDPSKVSATELLEIFFKMHDPTTKNRQGADVGTQYRRVERLLIRTTTAEVNTRACKLVPASRLRYLMVVSDAGR